MNRKALTGIAAMATLATLALGARQSTAASLLGPVHLRAVDDEVQEIVGGRPDTPANRLAAETKLDTPIELLKPIKCGPGLVVFSASTTASLRPFARSIGGWLEIMSSGQPGFDKSPRAGLVWDAISERRTDTADSNAAQNRKIAKVVGASKYAVGTLTQTGGKLRLVYSCMDTASGKRIGGNIVVEGSAADICKLLPRVAKSIVTAVGGSTAGMPSTSNLRQADFDFIRGITRDNADESEERMRALAEASPYAALYYFSNYEQYSNSDANWAAQQIARQMPDNAMALAELSHSDASSVILVADIVDKGVTNNPKSLMWQYCAYELSIARNRINQRRKTAETLVRLAPDNPESWSLLGHTANDEAAEVRRRVWSSKLSDAEWARLDSLYGTFDRCLQKTTALDPLDGRGWRALCEAATFEGRYEVADPAFWKAAKLDPDKADVYYWGLEMYQPKWFGGSGKLAKIAQLAMSTNWQSANGPVEVAGEMWNAGMAKERDALLKKCVDGLKSRIEASPNDPWAHWEMATAHKGEWRFSEALDEYRIAGKLMPHNGYLHYLIGNGAQHDHPQEAADEYRIAIADDPASSAQIALASVLNDQGNTAEALTQIESAIQFHPYVSDAHYTHGRILESMTRNDEALQEYRAAIDIDAYNKDAYEHLCHLLDVTGHYDEAIECGKQGLVASRDDAGIIDQLADVYLNKNQADLSAGLSQYAIGLNAKDMWAHENLGEAYMKQGKTAEARMEWELVAASDDKFMSDTAKSMLEKYPDTAK